MRGNSYFEATMQTMREVFTSEKRYIVPRFQRSYIWGAEEWEVLWEDLQLLREGKEKIHYMGPIVLQLKDEKEFWIIDGQQRLATLTLLMLAAARQFMNWRDEAHGRGDMEAEKRHSERAERIISSFVGRRDMIDFKYTYLLTLNAQDDEFFKKLLEEVLAGGSVRGLRPLRASHKQLDDCYRFFIKKFEEEFPNERDSQELAKFVFSTVADRLYFTMIFVFDETGAYLIFETLNARGVGLAPSDLIKNYLCLVLSKDPSEDVGRLSEKWDNLLPGSDPREFVFFLRAYINARVSPVVRKEHLYKQIKQEVKSVEDAKNFVEDLQGKAELYLALRAPANSKFWDRWDEDIRFYIELLNLFQARQYLPLVFAVHDAIEDGRIGKSTLFNLLRYIAIITLRYNVIGKRNPNQMERVYNEIAVGLFERRIGSWEEIRKELSQLYLQDEEFENEFAKAIVDNHRVAKYILRSLEEYAQNKENFRLTDRTILAIVDDREVTIEHIFPRGANNEWRAFLESAQDHEMYLSRLGNLTLLEASLNRRAQNLGFDGKRSIYTASKYALTREIAKYESWTPWHIEERQKELAHNAKSIWRLDF